MTEAASVRRHVELPEPRHGWDHPWPNVFELAGALPTSKWTLVGGLMVQAHAMAHGIEAIRPTADLDVLLHIEIEPAVVSEAHNALSELGYELQPPFDRKGPHYRYERGEEKVDVMSADHAAPKVRRSLRGQPMFAVEGGTQALLRTLIYEMQTRDGRCEISVPDELGALVLKGAAHTVDARDAGRHLFDAAVLAACVVDSVAERDRLRGSDRKRLEHLARALADPRHRAWLVLDESRRVAGQDALRILTAEYRPKRFS